MSQKSNIQVLWTEIKLIKLKDSDFVSLTDIARYKNIKEPKDVVRNWLRLRNTIDYLGLWETINNPNFKGIEFDSFKSEAGTNAFTLSPQLWIEKTNAIGIISKSWNNWWTFAHKDIAMKFASRISVEFELYLIKEFQRLKEQEVKALDRNVKRFLTKINYKIHTDAIKENLIPPELTKQQINFVYADEADLLNVALFGQTAKERREKNPNAKWNMRDESTIEQLIVLANIESMNAEYIKLKLSQSKRLELLNKTAISQIKSLLDLDVNNRLPNKILN
jgi:hypothetical protein